MSSSDTEYEAPVGEKRPVPDPNACPHPEHETEPVNSYALLVTKDLADEVLEQTSLHVYARQMGTLFRNPLPNKHRETSRSLPVGPSIQLHRLQRARLVLPPLRRNHG